MLEGLVAWVLRTYIGEYVENLNTDQLSIGIYQGQVELDNLPLRKDAFKNLDLPIEVKTGFIGKVHLAIPWSKLNSAPWVITLQRIYLVAGPQLHATYNEEEEKATEASRKSQQLAALEEKLKLQKNVSERGSSWWSFGAASVASAVTNIVENLQLNIKDVHVRYEDNSTLPGCSFAGGIIIKSLSAHSTDANWVSQFVSRTKAELMYKLADLKDFSLYWDTNAKMIGSLPISELEDVLNRGMYEHVSSGQFHEHQFILEPVCVQAKMKRNMSALPLRSQEQPRISLDIQLDKIPFELRESQYRGLVAWLREFERYDKARKYKKWRPTVKLKENARKWWNFAITSTLHFIKERNVKFTKEYLVQRVKDNLKYINAYMEHLEKGAYIDKDMLDHKTKCEEDWSFEEIELLREVAVKKIDAKERILQQQEALEERKKETTQSAGELAAAAVPPEQQQQQAGVFKRWFPGWGGWYGQAQPPGTEDSAATSALTAGGINTKLSEEDAAEKEKQIEKEILDVLADSAENNTFLKRDTVFARINFCLKSALVKLMGDNPSEDMGKPVSLLELECSAIELEFESRPRSSGMKFGVSVGGLFLTDKFTKDSIRPVLVSPQQHLKDNQGRHLGGQLSSSFASAKSLADTVFFQNTQKEDPLFQLVYEKKPFHSKADYKVDIRSKPLDIIYNPGAIQRIQQFFRLQQSDSASAPSRARVRYEELKNHTKADIREALGKFLEGDEEVKVKRWDFDIDIAAPQVILPESFTDSSKTLVVVDLGRLQLHNLAAGVTDRLERQLSDEEEDFVTPSSTPPSELSTNTDDVTPVPASSAQSPSHIGISKSTSQFEDLLSGSMSEAMVHDKIYDKYTLTLSELQVMVGTAQENWKHAQNKGTSKLHVVDKFSISLQLERRLLYTTDSQWPKATLSGTLPSLVLHVNELKVKALSKCAVMLKGPDEEIAVETNKVPKSQPGFDLNTTMYYSVYPGKNPQLSERLAAQQQKARQTVADSRLLLMQFSINHVSLEVQSRERSIAELQVSGVRANCTRRPFDMSLSFTVHSLLVVDAIQTYGTDFELLVASHKNLWIDSMSGSIRDSEPNSPSSPMSPQSPKSPGSPAEYVKPVQKGGSFHTLQATVSNALQSLVSSTTGSETKERHPSGVSLSDRPSTLPLDSSTKYIPFAPVLDSEALIKIELDIVTPECPSNSSAHDTLHIANIQFNSLDFVANQQTITELLSFVKSLSLPPPKTPISSRFSKNLTPDLESDTTFIKKDKGTSNIRWEVNADFHRLNVLLMREEDQKANKVATVTMSEAKIQATLAGDLDVQGSLDGLQLLNLTPDGKKHRKVFNLGIDANISEASSSISWADFPKPEMYKTANESLLLENEPLERAFSFSFFKPGTYGGTPVVTPTSQREFILGSSPTFTNSSETCAKLRMATLCYTHSPMFLKELSLCVSDFQEYMSKVSESLKSAATEVAMGLVQTRSEMSTSLHVSHANVETPKKSKLSTVIEEHEDSNVTMDTSSHSISHNKGVSLRLDALFQTPIIILPRTPDSSDVLVGHLGKIAVRNYPLVPSLQTAEEQFEFETNVDLDRGDMMYVTIKDLTVFSLDLEKQKLEEEKRKKAEGKGVFAQPGSSTKIFYEIPIVHNTEIEFTLQKLDNVEESNTNACDGKTGNFEFAMEDLEIDEQMTGNAIGRSRVEIKGRVVNELQVSLSKTVFEQILQTLDNIAPPDDDIDIVMEADKNYCSDANENLEPSLSSLKLDENVSSHSLHTSLRDRSSSDISTVNKSPPIVLYAEFELHTLNVKMTGDLGDGEQGLVDIQLQDFRVSMEKSDPHVKDIDVFLQSLVVEDLLIDPSSKHRQLMVSHASFASRPDLGVNQYLSSSCPASIIELPPLDMPPSLPTNLNRENVWDNVYDHQIQKGRNSTARLIGSNVVQGRHGRINTRDYPSTPPPSLSQSPMHSSQNSQSSEVPVDTAERLVHIKVKLVDKKSPVFKTKYNETQRYIDVDFNKLETILNLQTWVVLLDFLGMGAKAHDPALFTAQAQHTRQRHPSQKRLIQVKEEVNSEVNLKIQSLSLVLNKPEYELAKANVEKFTAHVSLRDGNFNMQGQLGSMSLLDKSPYGSMYRERFITTGSQALDFHLHKYGTPDPDLLREYDVSIKLRMTSVCYVHTQRFVQELLGFTQNFNQLQDLLGQVRAAAEKRKFQDKAFRSARIKMDIEAGAPIILIPHSTKTTDVLVMDLGKLSVHNRFVRAGSEGTISYSKEQSESYHSNIPRRPSEDTLRDRSSTSGTLIEDESFMTAASANTGVPEIMDLGLEAGEVTYKSEAPLVDLMTSSIYGSLERDHRTDTLSSTYDSSPDNMTESQRKKQTQRVSRVRTSSLNGYFEALGVDTPNTPLTTPPDSLNLEGESSYKDASSMETDYHSLYSGIYHSTFDPSKHKCLLDAMDVELAAIDLFSAEWKPRSLSDVVGKSETRLVFNSYVIERDDGKVLKEKGRLTLQVERNLEGEVSHAVSDINVSGGISSIHFSLDVKQYKLVKGLLAHNFGEPLEQFQKKVITHYENPLITTVLSGDVWKGISINLQLENVSVELLINHGMEDIPETSLARFDLLQSKLKFDSYSDQSKEIGLVSHQIRAYDTRYRDAPANVKPNVFDKILQPSKDTRMPGALQLELHYRSGKNCSRFTVLLNNMRLMGVFDWLLSVKDYIGSHVEDPWKGVEQQIAAGLVGRQSSAVSVSSDTGIATKRLSSVEEAKEPPFNFNLNVTDTELVVVENTADRDTIAVILKMTAILAYKPNNSEKPLTCNLGSLEVFSCSLSAEDETALSIIDPMQVSLELNSSQHAHHKTHQPSGLLEARPEQKPPPLLEVSFQSLIIRVSYSDMKLFLAILNSMPKQLLKAQEQNRPKNLPPPRFSEIMIEQLQSLGFKKADCERALEVSNCVLEDAAEWLTQNATPLTKAIDDEGKPFVSGVDVKCSSISLCLIDDCLDADVPLLELSVANVHVLNKLDVHKQGKATFRISGDYYNRSLSGWEPFLEVWPCHLTWQQNIPGEENKLNVEIKGTEVLNLNLTSVLMEQYKETQSKWTKEYYKEQESEHPSKRRSPFVPFAIRNHTGKAITFATLTTAPNRISLSGTPDSDPGHREIGEWRTVSAGSQLPFLIDEREKIRHKNTHELKVHQIIVCVDGWEAVSPVSLDKVGTYFREAVPKSNSQNPIFKEMPPARVVFDVTLEGSARKVITVRSALLFDNQLEDDVQVLLESSLPHSYDKHPLLIQAKTKFPIPLAHVHSKIWCRPLNWSLDWCHKPILWTHVRKAGEGNNSLRLCDTKGGEKATYRFCVSVYRQYFPMQVSVTGTSKHGMVYDQPGHVITLVPPLRMENLLPVDITFYLKGTGIKGTVNPGKMKPIVAVDLSQALELGVNLENFNACRELIIPPDTVDYKVKLRIYDMNDRLLELSVHILSDIGGSLKLTIGAPYWLVNRTGLPLVFKQDGTDLAAGQFEEHEVARSVTPLLFCYADKESRNKCTMRLGKKWLGEAIGKPTWCHRFSLERGCGVRPVHVKYHENRPDKVYNVGIDVRQGRGRYCDTNIVTFCPRYQLDNRSSKKLFFAQRHLAVKGQPFCEDYTSALPCCMVSYHWPRVDKDQLLCVKMSIDDSTRKVSEWTGGFKIDQVSSFHINMRNDSKECHFLRVDVVLQGATFYVVFSDADCMPPPYRIDNFSEVAITYFQTKGADDNLRSSIKPNTSVAYAWDEPVLPPHITLAVPGGSSATYNMDVIRDGDQLFYENFIYIALTATFKGSPSHAPQFMSQLSPQLPHYDSTGSFQTSKPSAMPTVHKSWSGSFSDFVNSQELVLEVMPVSQKVVLRKKELGNRFQLWRMTSTGLLQHEGTSTPRDPRKTSITSKTSSMMSYVLDVQDIALQPGRETNLMLRKPDERRKTTQTWMFTEDGRLCPVSSTLLCVQTKDGIFGLRENAEVVLGPSPPVMKTNDVPKEMQVSRQRMRPGSGLLSVKVITDGPTRVLQITDIKYQQYQDSAFQDDFILVEEQKRKPQLHNMEPRFSENKKEFEINLQLHAGLGISIVNRTPEEIMYIFLADISLTYTSEFGGQVIDLAIKSVQIDNQLLGASRPIVLFVTPAKDPEFARLPAIQLSAHKVPNEKWHAHIFRHLLLSMKGLTLQVEERLLWKFAQFLGVGQTDPEISTLEESTFESHRALAAATSSQFARYYFGTLKIQSGKVVLSVTTSSELTADLKAVKKTTRLPLVSFDEAKIELDPFTGVHIFETSTLLVESIRLHYTEELKSQAAKMLGSVDFLGNPLGLFNDVTEGISGLLTDGNVGGLVKNVTHGAFDSTAKVTGTLSDGITYLSRDDSQQRMRQKIKEDGSSSSHMKAAFKSLGMGVLGGLTSIVTQTYSGAKNEGIEGLATGVVKGVVGTVTRPVTGVLDFASETASAVRDTSKGSARKQPLKVRKPRCSYGPGGLLPIYSAHHAKAQEFLLKMNRNNFSEKFIAYEGLRFSPEDQLRVLISTDQVYFLGDNDNVIMLSVHYVEFFSCKCISKDNKYYIEVTMKSESEGGSSSSDPKKRPLVRCDSESIAQRIVQQINYARTLYGERRNTLPDDTQQEKKTSYTP